VYIVIEQLEMVKDEGITLGFEIFFVSVFSVEFLLKLVAYKLNYFTSAWNLFDFALVVIGAVGLVFLTMMTRNTTSGTHDPHNDDMSQEARVFRVNRVFRVLRIIRIFRLVNFGRVLWAMIMKKKYSLELSEQLQSLTVLKSFIKAHLHAQEKMLEYFGSDEGKPTLGEVAMALVMSQAQVYRAMYLAGKELEVVDPRIIRNVNLQRSVFKSAEELSGFVLQAHEDGVISSRMAETILHPIRDHMRNVDRKLVEMQRGLSGREAQFDGKNPGMDGARGSTGSTASEGAFYDGDDELLDKMPEHAADSDNCACEDTCDPSIFEDCSAASQPNPARPHFPGRHPPDP